LLHALLILSSCIDHFIHIAFPAWQIFFRTVFIDTIVSSCFNCFLHDSAQSVSMWDSRREYLSDMLHVWTCCAGHQWKQYVQYEWVLNCVHTYPSALPSWTMKNWLN
jgi:hypothetical protein